MGVLKDAEKANIARELLLGEAEPPAELSTYFAYYESVFCSSINPRGFVKRYSPAISTHEDVLECARRLRENPTSTREQLTSSLFPDRTIPPETKDYALRSVIYIMLMLNCSLKRMHSPGFKIGSYSPISWEAEESLVAYVERALPRVPMDKGAPFVTWEERGKELRAWKLKKRYHLQLRPTSNIAEHLLCDPATRTVYIFHHTAYLKAHLRRCEKQPLNEEARESLKLGTLPPQLLLETLYTIYSILFPVANDPKGKSNKLLSRLIRKGSFDADAKLVEYIRNENKPIVYVYWKARLEELYEFVQNRPPRNRFTWWIERHTSERNALTVAIIGLFLSAFFGLLACLIGIAQLVVAILAWKRPNEPS
ncbi:uncharacterized protein BJX67DRAFT_362679 [Aspergillus lucknowensis]|uniref:Uncharacterized protein n=1 Tax=Aspergillus lucknowensis TaxID=176173 RepID=A0ABR4LK53_9EURO